MKKINENESIYIEYLYYMKKGYEDIIKTILEKEELSSNYKKFMEEYQDANAEYQIAFNNIINKYYKNENVFNKEVMLDFDKKELSIVEKKGCEK